MSSAGESPEQTPNLDPSGSGAAEELALARGGWEKGLSRGCPFVTPGPMGKLALALPGGCGETPHESQPLCSPSLREGLCSPWDEGVGSDTEVPSCSALTVRRGSAPVASPMGQTTLPSLAAHAYHSY